MTSLRPGTRIEVSGFGWAGETTWEAATIGRMKRRNDVYPVAGYHPVTFADGGKFAVHESRFRVVDQRKAFAA